MSLPPSRNELERSEAACAQWRRAAERAEAAADRASGAQRTTAELVAEKEAADAAAQSARVEAKRANDELQAVRLTARDYVGAARLPPLSRCDRLLRAG